MDALEVVHRRLHNQFLSGVRPTDPVEVVRQLGAMQAQEYGVAKWSVGQRTAGCDDAQMQRLVDSGAILRTHALRPTWHFVAAADLAWIQALSGPRVEAFSAHYGRQLDVDDDVVARSNKAIVSALRGGNHLTRAELGEALGLAGISATGGRLGLIVMRAELDALIANGPMRGKQHTYALVSERAPEQLVLGPDEALAELTRRYFTSHGPATVKDFAWWSSLTQTQIKRGLALLGSQLVSEVVDGKTFWFAPGDAPARDRSPTAHVLQTYDEYGIAYTESRPLLNLAGRDLALPSMNSLVHPIVLDSQMVGWWKRRVERTGVVATLTLGLRLTKPQRRAVEAAFDAYAEFSAVSLTLEWPD